MPKGDSGGRSSPFIYSHTLILSYSHTLILSYYIGGAPVLSVPRLIYERRTALRLSYGDIGRACGYHGTAQRAVPRRWERGEALPPADRIRRLAAVLRVPPDTLLP